MRYSRPLCVLILASFALLFVGCDRKQSGESRRYVIGVVTNNPNGLANIRGFRERMTELGYIEDENVTYMHEDEPTRGDDLDTAIAAMVDAEVDLIFTAGTPTGVAAHRLTAGTEIPVVFGVIADPLAAGVMGDLTRPGGNMTGVRLSDNQDRRLQFLLELAPATKRVFVPYNPDDPAPTGALDQIRPAAAGLGLQIVEGYARDDREAAYLLQHIPPNVDAIFMLPDSTVNRHFEDLVATAIARKLPLSGPSMVQVQQGALTAFGIIHQNAGAQAAGVADQILRGADPANLPVQTAETYLGINLNTAQAIGLQIAPDLVQQAEFVVRATQ